MYEEIVSIAFCSEENESCALYEKQIERFHSCDHIMTLFCKISLFAQCNCC